MFDALTNTYYVYENRKCTLHLNVWKENKWYLFDSIKKDFHYYMKVCHDIFQFIISPNPLQYNYKTDPYLSRVNHQIIYI